MSSVIRGATNWLDVEGIVAKRADSPYQAGRHATWLKIKHKAYWRQAAVSFGREPATCAARAGRVADALLRGLGQAFAHNVAYQYCRRVHHLLLGLRMQHQLACEPNDIASVGPLRCHRRILSRGQRLLAVTNVF